jgi:cobalamin biosynthesis protein CbiD
MKMALYVVAFAILASGLTFAVMTPSTRLRERRTRNQAWNILGGIGLLGAIVLLVAYLLPGQ